MMLWRTNTIATFCLLLGTVAGAKADKSSDLSKQIDQLVHQLDDDSFQVREEAQRKLVKIGKPALAAVRRAEKHQSAEVRSRSRVIFRQMLGPDLVLYLPMDQRQLVLRQTDSPKCVKDRSANDGQAMSFPGNGYLIVPDDSELDTDDAFTLATWIKPTKIKYYRWSGHKDRKDKPTYPWGQRDASWGGHFIACKWDSQGANGDYIFAITPSGRLGLGVSNRVRGYVQDSLYTDKELAAGKWVHVASTFDRGEIKLYIDAELQCTKQSTLVTHTNRREYSKDDIYIGDFWHNLPGVGDEYNFHGAIDEFCVFSRALSEEQIKRVMSVTK